jgi:hypothetical protein
MKRSFWLLLFIFGVSILMAGCSCFPGSGQVAMETPPPQPAVVAPAPPPPPPQYVPPPKQDRN